MNNSLQLQSATAEDQAMPTQLIAPAPRPADGRVAPVLPRRRRDGAIASQLDMTVIGDVCAGIGIAGYRSVLGSFLACDSGSQAALLSALDDFDRAVLRERAHSFKGAAASLGLTALRAFGEALEDDADRLDGRSCERAATDLRALLRTTRSLLQRLGFTT